MEMTGFNRESGAVISSLNPVRMRFVSRPYWCRTGLWPMACIVGMAWIFVIMWLFVSIWVFQYNIYWSVTLTASTLAFSCVLGFMSYKMISDSFRDFVL